MIGSLAYGIAKNYAINTVKGIFSDVPTKFPVTGSVFKGRNYNVNKKNNRIVTNKNNMTGNIQQQQLSKNKPNDKNMITQEMPTTENLVKHYKFKSIFLIEDKEEEKEKKVQANLFQFPITVKYNDNINETRIRNVIKFIKKEYENILERCYYEYVQKEKPSGDEDKEFLFSNIKPISIDFDNENNNIYYLYFLFDKLNVDLLFIVKFNNDKIEEVVSIYTNNI